MEFKQVLIFNTSLKGSELKVGRRARCIRYNDFESFKREAPSLVDKTNTDTAVVGNFTEEQWEFVEELLELYDLYLCVNRSSG